MVAESRALVTTVPPKFLPDPLDPPFKYGDIVVNFDDSIDDAVEPLPPPNPALELDAELLIRIVRWQRRLLEEDQDATLVPEEQKLLAKFACCCSDWLTVVKPHLLPEVLVKRIRRTLLNLQRGLGTSKAYYPLIQQAAEELVQAAEKTKRATRNNIGVLRADNEAAEHALLNIQKSKQALLDVSVDFLHVDPNWLLNQGRDPDHPARRGLSESAAKILDGKLQALAGNTVDDLFRHSYSDGFRPGLTLRRSPFPRTRRLSHTDSESDGFISENDDIDGDWHYRGVLGLCDKEAESLDKKSSWPSPLQLRVHEEEEEEEDNDDEDEEEDDLEDLADLDEVDEENAFSDDEGEHLVLSTALVVRDGGGAETEGDESDSEMEPEAGEQNLHPQSTNTYLTREQVNNRVNSLMRGQRETLPDGVFHPTDVLPPDAGAVKEGGQLELEYHYEQPGPSDRIGVLSAGGDWKLGVVEEDNSAPTGLAIVFACDGTRAAFDPDRPWHFEATSEKTKWSVVTLSKEPSLERGATRPIYTVTFSEDTDLCHSVYFRCPGLLYDINEKSECRYRTLLVDQPMRIQYEEYDMRNDSRLFNWTVPEKKRPEKKRPDASSSLLLGPPRKVRTIHIPSDEEDA